MWNPETNIKGPKGDPGLKGDPGEVEEAPLDGEQYARQDGEWVAVEGGGDASITIADTPPAGLPGALWWESDSGTLFIRYSDGSSEQWVQAAATVSSGGGGGGGTPSDAAPIMDSVAAAGVAAEYARGDHVHPSDTSKASKTYVDTQDSALQTNINGKANTTHTHVIADVAGLSVALDGKADDADVTGKVAKTGDTMTGALAISPAAGAGVLYLKSAAGQQSIVNLMEGDSLKWQAGKQINNNYIIYDNVAGKYGMELGNNGLATNYDNIRIGSAGTVGYLHYGSTGTKYLGYDGANFTLNGGSLFASNMLNAGGDVSAGYASVNTGVYRFGNNNVNYLHCDGSYFNLAGASLLAHSNVYMQNELIVGNASANAGVLRFGFNGTKFLYSDGTSYSMGVGNLTVNGICLAVHFQSLDNGGRVYGNIQNKVGLSGGFTANCGNMTWDATAGQMNLRVDDTYLGLIYTTSDYRIKKDVTDLTSTWDRVKALRPVSYTHTEFMPPASDEIKAAQAALLAKDKSFKLPEDPLFATDDNLRWGFIAHELQETLVPTAATGVKDMQDGVQSVNLAPVVAALTKALQEAMARIEVLETRV